jgi:hypothetical protein
MSRYWIDNSVPKAINRNPDCSHLFSSRLTFIALGFLFFVLITGSVQRLLFQRSGIIRVLPVASLPSRPEGVDLSVVQVRPDPQNKYLYHVPAMVKSFFPDHVLTAPRSVSGSGGTVLVGRTAAGHTEVQTCLMDSGVAQVDLKSMLWEDQRLAASSRFERVRLTLIGALTGRPRSRRPCWLVQLKAGPMLKKTYLTNKDIEAKLLEVIWPTLKDLRSRVRADV